VTTRTLLIAPTREGRVTDLPYGEGDTVRLGALLARVEPGLGCPTPDTTRLVALRMDTQLNRARWDILGQRLATLRDRLQTLSLRSGLELDMELRREKDRLALEIEDLALQHRLLNAEISLQSRALGDAVAPVVRDSPACQPDLVLSPGDGTINAVYVDEFSVVNAGDAMLSLKPLDAPIRAMAYSSPDILPSLFPGKGVRVRFPDGSRDDGVIEAVHAAAELFPRLDVEAYRYLPSEVVVEIRPVDASQAERWRRFERLPVQVTGRKGGS
jgi:multidrug efflux pump subunit AcrA (membrane-fusion protein)